MANWNARQSIYRVYPKISTFLCALSFYGIKFYKSFFSTNFIKKFSEIADDIFHFLNFVTLSLVTNILKMFYGYSKRGIQFCSYLFLVFFLQCIFTFLHFKRAHKFWDDIFYSLKYVWVKTKKNVSNIHPKIVNLFICSFFSKCSIFAHFSIFSWCCQTLTTSKVFGHVYINIQPNSLFPSTNTTFVVPSRYLLSPKHDSTNDYGVTVFAHNQPSPVSNLTTKT